MKTSTAQMALEALELLDPALEFVNWENGDGEEIGMQLRNAAAALKAEIAQAVEPVDTKCQPDGIAHMIPPITLNGHELRNALQFLNPDLGDTEQLEDAINIQYKQAGKDIDGDDAPAGHYAWFTDYPEEGSIRLDDDKSEPYAVNAELSDGGFTGMSEEADFSTGTWTFKMGPGYRVGAGQYRITPIPKKGAELLDPAAAPQSPAVNAELLEAAKLGLSISESWINQEFSGEQRLHALAVFDYARAAIAKATKEQS